MKEIVVPLIGAVLSGVLFTSAADKLLDRRSYVEGLWTPVWVSPQLKRSVMPWAIGWEVVTGGLIGFPMRIGSNEIGAALVLAWVGTVTTYGVIALVHGGDCGCGVKGASVNASTW